MPKKLTGKEKHAITLAAAAKLTAKHRANISEKEVKSLFFGSQALLKLLKQKGCIGLRAYYGLKPGCIPTLVLVGVDKAGEDITKGVILDFGYPCPPWCPMPNPLNS